MSLYQCYGVEQGSAPPHRLSIDDQFTNDTPERVGKLKLLCTLANWSILEGPLVNTNGEANGDHLMCYEVSQVQATKSVVTLEDAFGTQTVKVQGPSRYVCVVAIKTCLSGCPVVTPP